MKNKIFPHKFWRPFLDCMPQLFFRPKYVWFPIHWKGSMIPDPSGQLAELIVYITSTRVDLYSHQILLNLPFLGYSLFKIWPLTSKVKIMDEVKFSHKVCLTSYKFTSLAFHVSLPIPLIWRFFQNFTLKIWGQGHKPIILHNIDNSIELWMG